MRLGLIFALIAAPLAAQSEDPGPEPSVVHNPRTIGSILRGVTNSTQPQRTTTRRTTTTRRAPSGDPTVLATQEALTTLGYNPGPADGLMGGQTRTAIQAWQAQNGFPATGTLTGPELAQLQTAAAQAEAQAAALNGDPRTAQSYLTQLGYNPGPIDGAWGPRSQAALDAWRVSTGRPAGVPLTGPDVQAMGVQLGILPPPQPQTQVATAPQTGPQANPQAGTQVAAATQQSAFDTLTLFGQTVAIQQPALPAGVTWAALTPAIPAVLPEAATTTLPPEQVTAQLAARAQAAQATLAANVQALAGIARPTVEARLATATPEARAATLATLEPTLAARLLMGQGQAALTELGVTLPGLEPLIASAEQAARAQAILSVLTAPTTVIGAPAQPAATSALPSFDVTPTQPEAQPTALPSFDVAPTEPADTALPSFDVAPTEPTDSALPSFDVAPTETTDSALPTFDLGVALEPEATADAPAATEEPALPTFDLGTDDAAADQPDALPTFVIQGQ